jgi:hypothetical protein
MAFINISKLISNGNAGDELDALQSGKRLTETEAYVPFGEYIDEFVRLSAEVINEYHSRVPRILYEDLLNGTNSEMFKMAESFVSSLEIDKDTRKTAVQLMINVFKFINIDNCIRIHFSNESEINKLIRLSVEKLPDNATCVSTYTTDKDVFVRFIVPYIREYINKRIEFTDKDKEAYDAMYSNDISKGEHISYICVEDFGVPLSSDVKEDRLMYTYSKPMRNGTDVSFLGKSLCRFSSDREFTKKMRLDGSNDYPDFNEYGYMYSLSEGAMNEISPFFDSYVINDLARSISSELKSMPTPHSPNDIRHAFESAYVSDEVNDIITSQYVLCNDEYLGSLYKGIIGEYPHMTYVTRSKLCPRISIVKKDGDDIRRSNKGFSLEFIPDISKLSKIKGIGAMDLDVIISEHIASYFKPIAEGYILKEMLDGSDNLRHATYMFRDDTPLEILDKIYGLKASKTDGFSRLRGVASVCMVAYLRDTEHWRTNTNKYKPYLTTADIINVEFNINSGTL